MEGEPRHIQSMYTLSMLVSLGRLSLLSVYTFGRAARGYGSRISWVFEVLDAIADHDQ
jgi:hypothetical protein